MHAGPVTMSEKAPVELVSLADSLQPLKDHINAAKSLHLLAVVSPT
jgi:hypothetical protein